MNLKLFFSFCTIFANSVQETVKTPVVLSVFEAKRENVSKEKGVQLALNKRSYIFVPLPIRYTCLRLRLRQALREIGTELVCVMLFRDS